MNAALLKRHLSFLKKPSVIKLGRWKMQNDQEIIDLKVDLANHDSCGGPLCTSVPFKEKKQNIERKTQEIKDEEEMLQYYMLSSFHLHVKKE